MKEGSTVFGNCLRNFMIIRPTLGCGHLWEFVYTECHHDVIMTLCHGNGPACYDFSRRRISSTRCKENTVNSIAFTFATVSDQCD